MIFFLLGSYFGLVGFICPSDANLWIAKKKNFLKHPVYNMTRERFSFEAIRMR
jgi:hypothetical protein